MKKILITGSAGLIGSQAAKFFIEKDFTVVGIDNNMRAYFFGEEASTKWNKEKLETDFKDKYIHHNIDIRDKEAIAALEKITGKKANVEYTDVNREGDHIWYISDVRKFKEHYPTWNYVYDIDKILEEIVDKGHF